MTEERIKEHAEKIWEVLCRAKRHHPMFSQDMAIKCLATTIAEVAAEARKERIEEIQSLIDAGRKLWPHIHEENMEGETNFERAWLNFEKELAKAEQLKEQG